MDWFLIIASIIILVLLLGVCIYLLALYCHRNGRVAIIIM